MSTMNGDTVMHNNAPVVAMKIVTTNDSSGNPRKGWLIYDHNGSLVGFCDEDYDGRQALKRVTVQLDCQVIELGIVDVPVKEYRTARKHRQF